MISLVQRATLVVAVLLCTAYPKSAALVSPATLTLDGLRDDGYRLLAQDPTGDLASVFSSSTDTNWADLTNLYVTTDTTHLWVYVDLPQYGIQSTGEFALAVDTDGVAVSGSSSGPNPNAITFAYTSTRNNVGATPVLTTNILLPDVLVHGYLGQPSNGRTNRWVELNRWTGAAWEGSGVNWGGVTTTMIGEHVGFAYGHGAEFSIPYSDLGVPPTTTLHLEFITSGPNGVGPNLSGAWDTVPSDDQSLQQYQSSTLRRLATFDLLDNIPVVALSSADYAVTEADGTVPITITVAPTSAQLISVTFQTADGTAGPADYVAVSQVVTFAPGQSRRVVPLVVLPDALVEPDETVFIELSQPVNAQLAQPITATLLIHDTPPAIFPDQLFLPLLRR